MTRQELLNKICEKFNLDRDQTITISHAGWTICSDTFPLKISLDDFQVGDGDGAWTQGMIDALHEYVRRYDEVESEDS